MFCALNYTITSIHVNDEESAMVDDGGGNGLSLGTISGIVGGGIVIIIIGGGTSLLVIFLFKKKKKTISVGM